MKLYAVYDGPPSLAVRMALKALDIPYELINVNYCAGEHLTEEYAKLNPQNEIPVLDDDGFLLSESVAILQYLCDKYRPDSILYPKDPKERAIVNHRLIFNTAFYYNSIFPYVILPMFFDYERTPLALKKVQISLKAFETYLERLGTKYVASDHLTIADFPLITATFCFEAINFNLDEYPLVKQWYDRFKKEYPELWEIAKPGMEENAYLEHHPPDLTEMEKIGHPIHPMKKK